MPATDLHAIAYLCPRRDSFWQWSPDGQAITWADGKTIAFRGEIHKTLARLAPAGLPPFGAVVLLVAACRDAWLASGSHRGLLAGYARSLIESSTASLPALPFSISPILKQKLQNDLERVLAGLDRVAALPPELRQPIEAKLVLAETVFETAEKQLDSAASASLIKAIESGEAMEIVQAMQDGRGNRVPHAADDDDHKDCKRFAAELNALLLGLSRVNPDRLALRNRTGLEQLIEKPDLNLPPPQRIRNLLLQLSNDPELAGLARLARNIIAAVHVPRNLSDPEELPLGGVSGLVNRGPLDRLLISELAHDDLTLATRIALNEAMYLRRESPASNPPPSRAILLDVGIRLWGIPRVFAAAVALALSATSDPHADLAVYRARDAAIDPVDLTTKAGLLHHLEALQPHPHPGPALKPFIEATRLQAGNRPVEAMLVTHEDVLADPDFLADLHNTPDTNWFIATVTRSGAFQLHQITDSGRKIFCHAELSLDEILSCRSSPAETTPLRVPGTDPALPVILSVDPLPLLLPHAADARRAAASKKHGLVAATDDGRLLHWTTHTKGARQLTDRLPFGSLGGIFLDDDRNLAYVLFVHQKDNALTIVAADLITGNCIRQRVSANRPQTIGYRDGAFLLMYKRECSAIIAATGQSLPPTRFPDSATWLNARFCRSHNAATFAAAFDGAVIRFEKVTTQPCVAAFDREGSGPWFLLPNGDVAPAIGKRLSPAKPFNRAIWFVGASPDGHRIAVRAVDHDCKIYLLDLEKPPLTWTSVGNNVHDLLFGNLLHHSNQASVNPRRHFYGIANTDRQQLILAGRNCLLAFTLDHQGNLILTKPTPFNPHPTLLPFKKTKGPPDTRYQLRVATFADGSRAYLDGRGMLHLKSSDPALPEITLVLTDGPIAGWSSEGHTFGWSFFLDRPATSNGHYFHQIIQQFLARVR